MNIGGEDLLSQIEQESPKTGIYLRRYILPSIQSRGLPGHVLATPTDKPGPVELTPLANVQTGGVNQIIPGANISITPTNGKGTVTVTAANSSGPPVGAAGGDLNGTYPNPTVDGINGGPIPVSSPYIGTDASGKIITATPPVGGSVFAVRIRSVDYTAVPNDAVFMDTSGGGHTVFLPPASGSPGATILVKKTSTDSNNLTIGRAGSDLIDGQTSLVSPLPYQSFTLVSDGVSNWGIF